MSDALRIAQEQRMELIAWVEQYKQAHCEACRDAWAAWIIQQLRGRGWRFAKIGVEIERSRQSIQRSYQRWKGKKINNPHTGLAIQGE